MNPHYTAVARRAGYRCEYCRAPERVFNSAFEVEHIQPQAAGGPSHPDNLALSCRACNLFKGDAQVGRDEQTGEETALFHPRQAIWDELFHLELSSGYILGKTPQGRATVSRLQINRPRAVAARHLWIEIGLLGEE